MVLSQGEGAWVPVCVPEKLKENPRKQQAVYASTLSEVEVAPGLWPTGETEGMAFILNDQEQDVDLDPGKVVGEIAESAVSTTVCNEC